MKVSIIIPIYNVSPYIEACLKSVFNQTYKHLEIILVDDCGNDNSIEIAQKLIEEEGNDFEITLISHQFNKGLSASRNTGLKIATGDYVFFLDSDDTIASSCINDLIEPTYKSSFDIIAGDYKIVSPHKSVSLLNLDSGAINGNGNIMSCFSNGKCYLMAWNKLFNRQFLLANNLLFKDGILHEDILWSYQLACCAKSMYIVKKETYFYLIREGSITKKIGKKNFDSFIEIIKECTQYTQKRNMTLNKDAYNYIEGIKVLFFNEIRKSGDRSILKYAYQEFRKHKSHKTTVSWIINNQNNKVVRDIHYLFPKGLGYYIYLNVIKINAFFKTRK